MQLGRFAQELETFDRWRADLVSAIGTYHSWLAANSVEGPESAERVLSYQEALREEKITVAFLGEFSRGKTELINAIFFADQQRRLLPSEAGRTTMCPTELYFDTGSGGAYLRLLPIETRRDEISIAEYKREPHWWRHIPLEVGFPDRVAEALKQVASTRVVPVEEARQLGLFDDKSYRALHRGSEIPSEVPIPRWRHALISYPHPLLQQGLRVLDTPGLNALGAEPELTLSMLAHAQAIVFVLAADAGVSASDMAIWQQCVKSYRGAPHQGVLVVLNKIDSLWDELREPEAVAQAIEGIRNSTASQLGVPASNVFALSAQKGLLAKVRDDKLLLEKSGLGTLETTLAAEVLPDKQRLLRETLTGAVTDMVVNSRKVVSSYLEKGRHQLQELRSLEGQTEEEVKELLEKSQAAKETFKKNLVHYQSSRRLQKRHAELLLEALSLERIDQEVLKTRHNMVSSWTTQGLKSDMRNFFDVMRGVMAQANREAELGQKLVDSIFRKFHEEYGLAAIKPAEFALRGHLLALERLYQKAEDFRQSAMVAFGEHSFVVRRFFVTLVSQLRTLFQRSHDDAERWNKSVMNPLLGQIAQHQRLVDLYLASLNEVHRSSAALHGEDRALAQVCEDFEVQLEALDTILRTLRKPPPFERSGNVVPLPLVGRGVH